MIKSFTVKLEENESSISQITYNNRTPSTTKQSAMRNLGNLKLFSVFVVVHNMQGVLFLR
jgi:hypothetical protein